MNHKRILLVGPRVDSVATGLGMAFELLIDGLQKSNYPLFIVNTLWGGSLRNAGGLNLSRILVVAWCVLKAWWYSLRSDVLYLPVSTSKFGSIRDLLIINMAAALRVRIVLHLHGSGLKPFYESSSPRFQRLIRNAFSRADCCIVLGELLKDQFAFVENWQQKVHVVLNGTPIDESIIPTSHVKEEPKQGESWRFLFMSNLMPTKGYLEIAKACRELLQLGIDNFQCDICGEFLTSIVENQKDSLADHQSDFLQLVDEPEMKGHIHYHGTVSGDSKTDFLRNCHVLLLPTYHPWEGQPLCINEALAWATPVVTTQHRGIPEQVSHGENGYFVEPKSVESLTECLGQFLRSETPYESLSANARKHYEENFTNERHLDTLIPLIAEG